VEIPIIREKQRIRSQTKRGELWATSGVQILDQFVYKKVKENRRERRAL
jgi:hypothetical protein